MVRPHLGLGLGHLGGHLGLGAVHGGGLAWGRAVTLVTKACTQDAGWMVVDGWWTGGERVCV